MYDIKTKTLTDRRELLKIKARSLMAEAAIIRKAEAKQKQFARKAVIIDPILLNEMVNHRKLVVRHQSRLTGLALGFIRGRDLSTMEPYPTRLLFSSDWDALHKMVRTYGSAAAMELLRAQREKYEHKVYGTKPVFQRAKAAWPFPQEPLKATEGQPNA